MSFCNKCGAQLKDGASFCNKCGASVSRHINNGDVKSPNTNKYIKEEPSVKYEKPNRTPVNADAGDKKPAYAKNGGYRETTHSVQPKKKAKEKNAILWVLIIVLVIALGIIAFLFLKKDSNGTSVDNVNNEKIEIPMGVGEICYFGTYEQNGDESDGKEDIEWVIVSKDDETMMLISKCVLDVLPYSGMDTIFGLSWETCYLRQWLNNDYYNDAFTSEEQSIIEETTAIDYEDSDNNTIDKVFILSESEFANLTDAEKECTLTEYAANNGKGHILYTYDSEGNAIPDIICWLRSSGSDFAYTPVSNGNKEFVNDYYCVRPAICVDYDKYAEYWAKTYKDMPASESELSDVSSSTTAPYNQQVITIQSNGGSYMLALDEWSEESDWNSIFSCEAKVSENGTTTAYGEGIRLTPSGTFDVLFCIALNKPDTSLNCQILNKDSIWVDDSNSKYYNTLQYAGASYKDWTSAEDIYQYFSNNENNAAIFFSYNGNGEVGSAKAGGGSALFLFGRNGYSKATTDSGDIIISADDMITLLKYLDASKHPQITIY